MAKIDSNHLSDWKEIGRKTTSDSLHEVGQKNISQDRANARQMMERFVDSRLRPQDQNHSQRGQRANQNSQARNNEASKNAQRSNSNHEEGFVRAKNHSNGLNQLARNGGQNNAINRGTTNEALRQNVNADRPDVRFQPQANLQTNANQVQPQRGNANPVNTQNIAPQANQPNIQEQSAIPRRTNERAEPRQPQNNLQSQRQVAENPRANTNRPVAPMPAEPRTGEPRRDVDENRSRTDRKDSDNSSNKTGSARGRGAARGLSQLRDGMSFNAGAGGESGTDIIQTGDILENADIEDNALIVFNEFDSANPGIEMVLARRDRFEREVLKTRNARLAQLQRQDEQIGQEMRDVFASRSLSERLENLVDEDLRICSSDFHKSSVYGGLIG